MYPQIGSCAESSVAALSTVHVPTLQAFTAGMLYTCKSHMERCCDSTSIQDTRWRQQRHVPKVTPSANIKHLAKSSGDAALRTLRSEAASVRIEITIHSILLSTTCLVPLCIHNRLLLGQVRGNGRKAFKAEHTASGNRRLGSLKWFNIAAGKGSCSFRIISGSERNRTNRSNVEAASLRFC